MRIRCERCSTVYELDHGRLPPGGAAVKCTRCDHVFRAVPPGGNGAAGAEVPSGTQATGGTEPPGRTEAPGGSVAPRGAEAPASRPARNLPWWILLVGGAILVVAVLAALRLAGR